MEAAPTTYHRPNILNRRGQEYATKILNKLPWGIQSIDNLTELNPRYEVFSGLSPVRDARINRMSIFGSPEDNFDDKFNAGGIIGDKRFQAFMYSNVDLDKIRRIGEFRAMSYYHTVSDCLDEIADELLFEKDNTFVKLEIKDIEDKLVFEELQNEWNNFVDIFEFSEKGWDRFRRFLIEGELFFENIVSPTRPELGILGIVEIPTELIVPVFSNVQNNMIDNFVVRRPVIDPETQNVDHEDIIAMEKGQVTYISSGIRNEDGTIVLPYIENARRPYKQLSMMEDCIIIYRMARSPEKLLFNIDTGNMTPPNQEAYLKRLMHQFWAKKSFDVTTGRATNNYDPQSMTDAFWFPKRAGTEGSSVTNLTSTATFGQMDDLLHFQKEVYRAMHVPVGRLNPEAAFKDGNDSNREDVRFGKFIKRIQKRFAIGMKETFITHLKLRGLWKTFNLRTYNFDVVFNVSSIFDETRKQQFLDLKFNNFDKISGNEGISNSWAQKKYLGLTDAEIAANREWKRYDAAFAWELQQIGSNGPDWKKQLQAQQQALGTMVDNINAGVEGGPMGDAGLNADLAGGGGGGGGGGELVDMGGGEPAPGGEGGTPPDLGGGEAPAAT